MKKCKKCGEEVEETYNGGKCRSCAGYNAVGDCFICGSRIYHSSVMFGASEYIKCSNRHCKYERWFTIHPEDGYENKWFARQRWNKYLERKKLPLLVRWGLIKPKNKKKG